MPRVRSPQEEIGAMLSAGELQEDFVNPFR